MFILQTFPVFISLNLMNIRDHQQYSSSSSILSSGGSLEAVKIVSQSSYTFAYKDANPLNQVDTSFYQTFSFPSLQDSTGNVGNLENT